MLKKLINSGYRKIKETSKKNLICTLLTVLAAGGIIYYDKLQTNKKMEALHPAELYLMKNSKVIEKEAERMFGIKLNGVKVSFVDEIKRQTKSNTTKQKKTVLMNYNHLKDLISVSKKHASKLMERGFYNYYPENTSVKGCYLHELGHDYFYQTYDKLNLEGKVSQSNKKYLQSKNLSVIKEGISEYFAIEPGENKPKLVKKHGKTDKEKYSYAINEGKYVIGKMIVSPILNRLGVKRGVAEILKQPIITKEEILNPKSYQKRIIKSGLIRAKGERSLLVENESF